MVFRNNYHEVSHFADLTPVYVIEPIVPTIPVLVVHCVSRLSRSSSYCRSTPFPLNRAASPATQKGVLPERKYTMQLMHIIRIDVDNNNKKNTFVWAFHNGQCSMWTAGDGGSSWGCSGAWMGN